MDIYVAKREIQNTHAYNYEGVYILQQLIDII